LIHEYETCEASRQAITIDHNECHGMVANSFNQRKPHNVQSVPRLNRNYYETLFNQQRWVNGYHFAWRGEDHPEGCILTNKIQFSVQNGEGAGVKCNAFTDQIGSGTSTGACICRMIGYSFVSHVKTCSDVTETMMRPVTRDECLNDVPQAITNGKTDVLQRVPFIKDTSQMMTTRDLSTPNLPSGCQIHWGAGTISWNEEFFGSPHPTAPAVKLNPHCQSMEKQVAAGTATMACICTYGSP